MKDVVPALQGPSLGVSRLHCLGTSSSAPGAGSAHRLSGHVGTIPPHSSPDGGFTWQDYLGGIFPSPLPSQLPQSPSKPHK